MSKKLKLSKRAKKIPKSGIRKMFNLAQKYTDVVNLSIGEPDFDTPPHIVEAAVKAMKEGYIHYTVNAGFLEFRKAISEKLRKENRIDADPETEIMATAGAMGGLSLAFLTLIDHGDEVPFQIQVSQIMPLKLFSLAASARLKYSSHENSKYVFKHIF
jgi:aminotransferase